MPQTAHVRTNEHHVLRHTSPPLRIVTCDTTPQEEKAESLCLPISQELIHAARGLGQIRTALHNANRKPWQNLGAKKNLLIDYMGILGELLVLDALCTAGLHPTNFDVLSHPTPCGPDFCLNGSTYNVKTVLPSDRRQYLNVNEAQRLHPQKRCHFYLPVVLSADRTARILAPVPSVLVATWPLRQGHSPYRSCPVDTLEPLGDIRDLAQ